MADLHGGGIAHRKGGEGEVGRQRLAIVAGRDASKARSSA